MLHQQIKSEIPTAMKAKDQVRLDTLRMLTSAFVNELVATKHKPDEELSDEGVIGVIRREVKKRKEAAEAFDKGGRADSAAKEREEQKILEAYLPAQMSEEDVKKVVDATKAKLSITDKKDVGTLMKAVMTELKGKADGALVKKVIDAAF